MTRPDSWSAEVARRLIESFPDVPPLSQLGIEFENSFDDQCINRLDLRHPPSIGPVRPALDDSGHGITQPPRCSRCGREIDPTQRVKRSERFIHHRLLTLHGPLTRYGIRALLASRGWLQRRAWVRRAAFAGAAVGYHTPSGEA